MDIVKDLEVLFKVRRENKLAVIELIKMSIMHITLFNQKLLDLNKGLQFIKQDPELWHTKDVIKSEIQTITKTLKDLERLILELTEYQERLKEG